MKLNKFSEDLADRPDESHRALVDVAYKNVNDLDGELVPVERHVKAFRYGKQHVPIDTEMEQRLSMRFDKGLKSSGRLSRRGAAVAGRRRTVCRFAATVDEDDGNQ